MSKKTDNFIAKISPLAISDFKNSKVLPSLTIAQAILESGWGESVLAKKANNLFGIKATKDWKGKAISKDTLEYFNKKQATSITAYFKVYDDWLGGIKDHSKLLSTSRYTDVILAKDYKEACEKIAKAGYATDPEYSSKLIALIEKYKLYEYDNKVKKVESTEVSLDDHYRVRKSWSNASSQIGAFKIFENAKRCVDQNGPEFKVFNKNGEQVYPK